MIFLFWRIYRFVEAAAAADRVSARIWRVTIETHQQYFSLCLHIWGEEVTFGEMDFLGSSKLSLIGRNTFPILVPASEWRRRLCFWMKDQSTNRSTKKVRKAFFSLQQISGSAALWWARLSLRDYIGPPLLLSRRWDRHSVWRWFDLKALIQYIYIYTIHSASERSGWTHDQSPQNIHGNVRCTWRSNNLPSDLSL